MATCLNAQKDVLNCSLMSLLNIGLIIVLANLKIQTSFRTCYSFIYLGEKENFPQFSLQGSFHTELVLPLISLLPNPQIAGRLWSRKQTEITGCHWINENGRTIGIASIISQSSVEWSRNSLCWYCDYDSIFWNRDVLPLRAATGLSVLSIPSHFLVGISVCIALKLSDCSLILSFYSEDTLQLVYHKRPGAWRGTWMDLVFKGLSVTREMAPLGFPGRALRCPDPQQLSQAALAQPLALNCTWMSFLDELLQCSGCVWVNSNLSQARWQPHEGREAFRIVRTKINLCAQPAGCQEALRNKNFACSPPGWRMWARFSEQLQWRE